MRRRSYLAGVTACFGWLAGCSSDDGPSTDTEGNSPTSTDGPDDGTQTGTPSPTPMPEEQFAAQLTVKAEESGLEGEFSVVTGEEGSPYLGYSAVKGGRGDQRDRARTAYDSLVEEGTVGRQLDARVRNRETGEQWYRWRAEEAWAKAYLAGEMSEGEYQQEIDKTVKEW